MLPSQCRLLLTMVLMQPSDSLRLLRGQIPNLHLPKSEIKQRRDILTLYRLFLV